MLRLTDILDRVKAYHPDANIDLIHRAYLFCVRKHEGQQRKSGDPYVVHPLSVANIIADLRMDAASVAAALLHDVVEDTGVPISEIKAKFGDDVAFLVDGVTKLGKVNFTSREDHQAESFRKMLIAMAKDIRVLVLKLADRLDNMRTLDHMAIESRERTAQETREVFAPLAGRLGIQWLLGELEDLSFKYLEPTAYEQLSKEIEAYSKNSDKYIVDVANELRRLLMDRGFTVEVVGRRKHLYSIYRKIKRTGADLDQIHDFVAFRVITETVADCYAALGVIHSEWTPIPGRFKDFIALPKPNMYQSLHTTVIGPKRRRVEVQIRTRDMHKTAEYGIAAHWQYKENSEAVSPKDAARFTWLRQLMESQQELHDPEEFFESVKSDLFEEEVFVFTPKGDVKTLPSGSTAIDFAYAVHSEVGQHCAGVRVNGIMVPLRTQLQNGDIVEIMTNPKQHPSKDWIDFAATTRARSRIRAYIRNEERTRSLKLGKDLIEREMKRKNLSLSRFSKSEDLQEILGKLRANSLEDLYGKVGFGHVSAAHVIKEISSSDEDQVKQLQPSLIERTVDRVRNGAQKESNGIRIEGQEDIMVRFARCCSPVVGDPITGWITRGRGVSVHRRGCPRAMALDSERRIDVSWTENSNFQLPVSLRVTTDDRTGILSKISGVFSENQVSISEALCMSKEGKAENTFHFQVSDLQKLRTIMRSVAKLQGVLDVERV